MGSGTVSADASVLIVLAKSGRLGVLGVGTSTPIDRAIRHGRVGNVFAEVLVEASVEHECLLGLPSRPDARAIEAALASGALKRAKAPPAAVRALAKRHPSLGPGEVGAIALAGRGLVLVDDGLARRVARLEGAVPVGTLGILARAHRGGAIGSRDELAAALRDVLSAGLWVDASIIEAFWAGVRAK